MQNQHNQTSELQINLSKFEELAKEFIKQYSDDKEEFYCSYKSLAEDWTADLKEFIFADELIQQKRKEEYFKLKEKLESMKAEFEPELVKDDEVTYSDFEGEYVAVKEGAYNTCDGCAFANRSCGEVIESYSCGEHKIIWKTK